MVVVTTAAAVVVVVVVVIAFANITSNILTWCGWYGMNCCGDLCTLCACG